jgi:cytochrome c oxidase subunit 3
MSAIALSDERRTSTGRSNNWWGLVLVIVAETMFFGSLISAYVFLRAENINWLPGGTINLDPLLPALNTVILLASSLAVHQASSALRGGESVRLQRWLPAAAALGIAFLGLQGLILVRSGFTPLGSAFGSVFYTLIGFHALRIVIGLALMAVAFVKSRRGELTPGRHFALTAASAYWHFLDVVWIVLFALLYWL